MAAAGSPEKFRLSTSDDKYYGVAYPEPNGRVAIWECDGIGGVTVFPSVRAAASAVGANQPGKRVTRPMHEFVLQRNVDAHNTSGEGVVAVGMEFPDGTCAMGWLSEPNSVQVFDDIEHIEDIHGHSGGSEVVYSPNWEAL